MYVSHDFVSYNNYVSVCVYVPKLHVQELLVLGHSVYFT